MFFEGRLQPSLTLYTLGDWFKPLNGPRQTEPDKYRRFRLSISSFFPKTAPPALRFSKPRPKIKSKLVTGGASVFTNLKPGALSWRAESDQAVFAVFISIMSA
jgi:hypothetical protein